jgi:hypothetical protein
MTKKPNLLDPCERDLKDPGFHKALGKALTKLEAEADGIIAMLDDARRKLA